MTVCDICKKQGVWVDATHVVRISKLGGYQGDKKVEACLNHTNEINLIIGEPLAEPDKSKS